MNQKQAESKKAAPDLVTDKFSDNAGDNTVTRFEVDNSIISKATANEHSFRQAMMEGLEESLHKKGDH